MKYTAYSVATAERESTHKMTMSSRILSFLLLIFGVGLLFGFGSQGAQAATYYVATTGSDSANGSIGTPWLTLEYGADQLAAGDTMYARGGVYTSTMAVYNSGTAGNPITIAAYPSEVPVIDVSYGNGQYGSLIDIQGDYVHIDGFELRHSFGYGIEMVGHDGKVSNVNAHHNYAAGIHAAGDNSIVEDSTIWWNSSDNCRAALSLPDCPDGLAKHGSSGWGIGMSASRDQNGGDSITNNAIFRRNTVFNNWGEGLSTYEADGTIMEDNVVYDNWATNTYISDARNVLFQRNMVYVTPGNAVGENALLTLADELSNKPRSMNNTVVNNLFLNGPVNLMSWTEVPGSSWVNGVFSDNTLVNGTIDVGDVGIVNSGSRVENNIFVGTGSVYSAVGVTWSHNLWHGTRPANAVGTGDVLGDPLLALTGATTAGNLTADYFRLSTVTSIAVDAAMAISEVVTDYFQVTANATPDMGAIEYVGGGGDVTAPTITSVSSTKANGTYGVGEVIDINVTFSENVTSTGSVTVTLETGATDRTCTFTVTNASTGSCNYTVQAGDASADLQVNTIAGTIADQSSNAMTNFVPTTNLAASKALVIDTTADTTAPTITSVSSTKANGTYGTGEVIDINVTFSENVTSTGSVTVTLETGATDRTCTFTVTNASTGSCNYTVQAGDASADLQVNTIAGTIADQSSNAMTNFVPTTNLAASKALVIDTIAPTVPTNLSATAVSSTAIDLSWTASTDTVGPIVYTIYRDGVQHGMSSGTTFPDTTGLSPSTNYVYTVSAHDAASNTSVQSSSANATTHAVVVDITAPTITSVSSTKANGTYGTGEVIDINVTFSENVTSTGSVTVTLETGATDRTCTFTVTNASTGSCNYTVQAGDASADLQVNTIAGTITDQSSNAMTNFVPTTNLAASKALVIDTTVVPVVVPPVVVPVVTPDTTTSTPTSTVTSSTSSSSGSSSHHKKKKRISSRIIKKAGDKIAPFITLVNPKMGTWYKKKISIAASAFDKSGIQAMFISVDGKKAKRVNTNNISFTYARKHLSKKVVSFKIQAYDAFGNVKNATFSLINGRRTDVKFYQ